jgi:hypothetical protein
MEAVDLWFQFRAYLIEQVGHGGVIRRFPRPRQAANPRYLVKISIDRSISRHRHYTRQSAEEVSVTFMADDLDGSLQCPRRYGPEVNDFNKPRRGAVIGQSCWTRLPRIPTYQS